MDIGNGIKRRIKLMAAFTVLAAATGTASASPIVFDFESVAAGDQGLSLALLGGDVDLTITRLGLGDVEVALRSAYPASWGSHALSPFLNTGGGAFLLTFSKPISSISVDVGDFAPSDDDAFSLTVGLASALGLQDGSTGFPIFFTLSLGAVNSTTAILSGGSATFPQSVFWDNITVTVADAPVPEPSTLALLACGLLAVGYRRLQS